jgi:hypothetical protein
VVKIDKKWKPSPEQMKALIGMELDEWNLKIEESVYSGGRNPFVKSHYIPIRFKRLKDKD